MNPFTVTFLVIAAVLAMWGTGYWWLTSEHQAPRRATRSPAGAARARWQAIVRACHRAGTTWGRNLRARLPQWPAWLLDWAWNRQATPYTPPVAEREPICSCGFPGIPREPSRLATAAERDHATRPWGDDTGGLTRFIEAGEA